MKIDSVGILVAASVLALCSACKDGGGGSDESGTETDTDTSGTETETDGVPSYCEGATELIYAPLEGTIDLFPDDFFTVDADTQSGVMVNTIPGDNVILDADAMPFASVFEAASTLDGFGTTAGAYLQFTGPIDPASLPASGDGSGAADASLVIVDLDAPDPVLVDFEWKLVAESASDNRNTLILEPMVPLRPETRYGIALTSAVLDADGMCVAPSQTMRELLDGTAADPDYTRLGGRIDDLLVRLIDLGTITAKEELTAAAVFTTQRTTDDSESIALAIQGQAFAYTAVDTCTDPDPGLPYLVCEGTFDAGDYRVDGRAIDEDDLGVKATYTLPITTYLPKTGTAPFPTVVFGHGLTGERQQAAILAEVAAPEGYATISIDSPKHGEHPDQPEGPAVLDFFGLSLDFSNPLDALALRDNFRQASYDKLQLLELLLAGIDLDGDATTDLDSDRLVYVGVSLGGLMGPEFLALAPRIGAGVLIVPGARVSGIVAEGDQFSVVVDLFKGMATDGAIARFFPILQTVIDRGDPGVYAPHVAANRLPDFGPEAPQLLMQMVLDDDTVPNSTNLYLARSLAIPHVGEELLPIGVVPLEPDLPTSANLDATHTAGTFQFDIVQVAGGPDTEPATHSNVGRSAVGLEQSIHFIRSHLARGVAEIVDPYVVLGVKP